MFLLLKLYIDYSNEKIVPLIFFLISEHFFLKFYLLFLLKTDEQCNRSWRNSYELLLIWSLKSN